MHTMSVDFPAPDGPISACQEREQGGQGKDGLGKHTILGTVSSYCILIHTCMQVVHRCMVAKVFIARFPALLHRLRMSSVADVHDALLLMPPGWNTSRSSIY